MWFKLGALPMIALALLCGGVGVHGVHFMLTHPERATALIEWPLAVAFLLLALFAVATALRIMCPPDAAGDQ